MHKPNGKIISVSGWWVFYSDRTAASGWFAEPVVGFNFWTASEDSDATVFGDPITGGWGGAVESSVGSCFAIIHESQMTPALKESLPRWDCDSINDEVQRRLERGDA